MDYIICKEPGVFRLMQKDPPAKEKGRALVRIKKVGICGTDLHAYRGQQAYFTYPRILGHELAGEILAIDSADSTLKPGDKVGIMPYIGCRSCYACRNGKPNCCTQLQVLGVHTDGGMQQVLSLDVDLLLPAADLDLREIALAEPLSIGAHAVRRAQLCAGEVALVMGCGPIGLGLAFQARMLGARVIAMDTSPSRLETARKSFGLEHVIEAGGNAANQLSDLTSGDMAAVVFDATGSRQAMELGPQFMAHGGRFVLVGLYNGALSYNHPFIHARETTLLCSRNATREDFESVMQHLRNGTFPVDAYITNEVPYQDMISSIDDWLLPERGVIKAIVSF